MFDRLKSDIGHDLQELSAIGRLSRAAALSTATGQRFQTDTMPQYFTGRLDAPIVLVHLNPKQDDDFPKEINGSTKFNDVESYIDYFQHFGRHAYGPDSPRTHKSPFDKKQIRFLDAFGAMEFESGDSDAVRFTNLERVVDDKLQLEIVPYGSSSFRTTGFSKEVLSPYWDLALDVIFEADCPRKCVIFCGAVFRPLVQDFIVGPMHEFHLKTAAGHLERNRSRFANLDIIRERDGRRISAGWAPSFSRQGIPMREYGAACKEFFCQTGSE